jgi:hypothetical protein
MRLRLRANRPPRYQKHGNPVDHGTVAQLPARPDCIFCRFIASQIDYAVKTGTRNMVARLAEARRAVKDNRHLRLLEANLEALESKERLLVCTTVRHTSSTVTVNLRDPKSGYQMHVSSL